MVFGPPPENYRGTPNWCSLEAGTVLWRVQSERYEVLSFNPRPADRFWGGGRFDCTADNWYPFLYAAPAEETALAEMLMRNVPFPGNGRKRTLQRQLVAGRRLHALRLRHELTLVSLRSAQDLAAIRQGDGWLVEADAREYAFTRLWAHWLRRVAPTAHGLIWTSSRNLGQPAVILFGDRCPQKPLELAAAGSRLLYDDDGAKFLNEKLAPYHADILPPRSDERKLSQHSQ